MLEPDEDGHIVATKSKTLDASAPITFEYGSQNPFKERTFEWTKLYGGMGQGTAPDHRPRRYSHAINADLSLDGTWMKGPNFEDHEETITDAGEIRQFILALDGGDETLFAICENGVWKRTADATWVESLTAGTTPALVGTPQQAVRFTGRYASPRDALYLGTSTSNLWEYDGTDWVEAAAAAGPGTGVSNGEARYVEKVGDEFWVAGDYWVVKAEADPMLRASYSGVIYIGDQSAKITWLGVIENTLYIFKEDGVYTVSIEGIDEELFPHFRSHRGTTNGWGAATWLNNLWFRFGESSYRIDAEGNLSPDGLDLLLENTSEVRGKFIAGSGHNTWFFYETYYNEALNTSYLIKHGTWIEDGERINPTTFSEAHHGAIAVWSGKRVTSCETVHGIHPSGNERLYVGFSDGTLAWCVLPQVSPNPRHDDECFIGTTEVQGEEVSGVSQRWYEGEVVEITTRNGHQLTGTPNHPILTQRGWIPLGLLVEGDSVFSSSRSQGMTLDTVVDIQDRPPCMKQVFDLASIAGTIVRHRGVKEEFHGDGFESDVDVVLPEGFLLDNIVPQLSYPFRQGIFPESFMGKGGLPTERESMQMVVGLGNEAITSMSGRHSVSTLLRRPSGVHQFPGSGVATDGDSPTFQVGPYMMRSQIIATPEGLSRLPSDVRRDDVVSVRKKTFAGHVYNLQTKGHWYIANGIVAHNCEFTNEDSYVYLPTHHANFRADNKLYLGISIFGPLLSNFEWATVEYRLDLANPVAAWILLENEDEESRFTAPGRRLDWPRPTENPAFGKAIQIRVQLHKDADPLLSLPYVSPVIDGLGIHEQVRPAFSMEYVFRVLATSFMARRDGSVDRRRGISIRNGLETVAASVGSTLVRLPSGALEEMTVVDYREDIVATQNRRDLEWIIVITAYQLRTITQDNISSGLTYDTLEQYTLEQLESII